MVDYYITKDFDLELTDWDDIKTVQGKEEFEQSLVITAHKELDTIIGSPSQSNSTEERIKLICQRIAEKFDVVDYIQKIAVNRTRNESSTVKIDIYYVAGDNFSELI